jgi:UDP-2,3-diacylglucosamine pyrophosphatase LpxH
VKIRVREERVLVISDLHLGNPFSLAAMRMHDFLDYVREGGWSLIINGDGLEILQASFTAMAAHSLDVAQQLTKLQRAGCNVYYVVGNHDITLEHLLHTWLGEHICPFLNVWSGEARIRVEHGHLYDPFFVNYPRLYSLATMAAAPLLHVSPDVYRVWSGYQRMKESAREWAFPNRPGHGSAFTEAAEMLTGRGFDAVVFGHTHKPEVVRLQGGGLYINSGNWMRGTTFVEIDHGRVALRRWHRGEVLTLQGGAPQLLVDGSRGDRG